MLNWRAGAIYERLIPSGVRAVVADAVVPHVPGRIGRYAQRSFLAMSRRPETMFLDNFAGMPLRLQRELLDPERATADPYAPSLAYYSRVNGANGMLGRLLYTDVKTYLVELLMKQDQMSMSASIESRVPFLDHTLVEFAATIPDASPSMRLDQHARRRSEVDVINGAVVDLSRELGLTAPYNQTLCAILRERESRFE